MSAPRGSMAAPAAILIALAALFLAPAAAEAQLARRSVACASCIGNWYYFDENATSGAMRDWNCGASTYDGHRGSDWSLSGGLAAIDAGNDVTAVADGTVVAINDGAYDRCTMCGGTMCGTSFGFGYGNYVRVDHGTRSVIYAHMRTRSLRVTMGARVTCGQVLGQIASSGCSTGAHLHTEFRPIGAASTAAYDPYQGSCSPTSPSAWTAQNAYRTLPGTTCDGMTPPPTCPSGTYAIWTCINANTARQRCISGVVTNEMCAYGCESRPVGTDDVCRPPPTCASGLGPEWTCNADRSARGRCNAGADQNEACAYGCRTETGDDVCNPAPMCPAGIGLRWTCTADRRARERCIAGRTETETCVSGCLQGTTEDTCAAPDGGTVSDAGTVLDASRLVDVVQDGPAANSDASRVSDATRASDAASRREAGDGGTSVVMGGCGCRVVQPKHRSERGHGFLVTAACAAFVIGTRRRRKNLSQL